MSYNLILNGIAIIDSFTEEENWGVLTNANFDIIDDVWHNMSITVNARESTRLGTMSDLNTASGTISEYTTTLDGYEDRIEDIEAVGEYVCDFTDLIADIQALEDEKTDIEALFTDIGLSADNYTGTFSYTDYYDDVYNFYFNRGILYDYEKI